MIKSLASTITVKYKVNITFWVLKTSLNIVKFLLYLKLFIISLLPLWENLSHWIRRESLEPHGRQSEVDAAFQDVEPHTVNNRSLIKQRAFGTLFQTKLFHAQIIVLLHAWPNSGYCQSKFVRTEWLWYEWCKLWVSEW